MVSFDPIVLLKNPLHYVRLSDGLRVLGPCDILISILGRRACLQFIDGAGLFYTSQWSLGKLLG